MNNARTLLAAISRVRAAEHAAWKPQDQPPNTL
eukprot:CAMPEP_0115054302 /NCGR_PEP_ID=MMETSP0227-20121206/4010_1 /TAXON_ID=89957 /ORGANISM="Polarella glacialis, Strain CCMP 1383" /LENGTH=32 /DNA_ID= /DNA_START= /DNA_END= /DNA_ORIENTATION=